MWETDGSAAIDLSHVNTDEKDGLKNFLRKYASTFACDRLGLGRCGVIKHRIDTSSSAPVYRRAYRIPYTQRKKMYRQINELVGKGIVEPSKSP